MITSLLIIANFLFANNEIYHHVNIKFDYDNQLLELFQLDIPIDHYQRNKDNSIDSCKVHTHLLKFKPKYKFINKISIKNG